MCECDLNTARDNELEVLKIHDFLSGLDEAVHGAIRSQISAISPLPDHDSVYQTIVQNETIRSGVMKESEIMGFASQLSTYLSHQSISPIFQNNSAAYPRNNSGNRDPSRLGPGNRDPSRMCTACGRSGHGASSCFEVVGYPEWWKDCPHKPNSRGSASPSIGRARGFQPRANITQIVAMNSMATVTTPPLTDADRQGLSGISDEQWRTIQRVFGYPTTQLIV